jgi:hypothetical protein
MIIVTRAILWSVLLGCAASTDAREAVAPRPANAKPTDITVYRSPTCGCCGKWLEQMKQQGFLVKDLQEADMDSIKDRLHVPVELRSCHTAVANGLVFEGHVPAADIRKLLEGKSNLAGIAVPGMPVGSPGMEMGPRRDGFSVIGFGKEGKTTVLQSYEAQ